MKKQRFQALCSVESDVTLPRSAMESTVVRTDPPNAQVYGAR